MSALTTHVLDTSRGRPAAGVAVVVEKSHGKNDWKEVSRGVTNADGRVPTLMSGVVLEKGSYRLLFDVAAYFRTTNTKSFYATISIHLEIDDPLQHYHAPLLLSPFGYSTYRGS